MIPVQNFYSSTTCDIGVIDGGISSIVFGAFASQSVGARFQSIALIKDSIMQFSKPIRAVNPISHIKKQSCTEQI